MKGRHREFKRLRRADVLAEAGPHGAGGMATGGDGDDLRRGYPLAQQPRDLVDQERSLASTRATKYEQWAIEMLDGRSLERA